MPLVAECDLHLKASKKQVPQGSKYRKHCSEAPSVSGSCGVFKKFLLAEQQYSYFKAPPS